MKNELDINKELNENLDVLFDELEEKDEFAMAVPASVVGSVDGNSGEQKSC